MMMMMMIIFSWQCLLQNHHHNHYGYEKFYLSAPISFQGEVDLIMVDLVFFLSSGILMLMMMTTVMMMQMLIFTCPLQSLGISRHNKTVWFSFFNDLQFWNSDADDDDHRNDVDADFYLSAPISLAADSLFGEVEIAVTVFPIAFAKRTWFVLYLLNCICIQCVWWSPSYFLHL